MNDESVRQMMRAVMKRARVIRMIVDTMRVSRGEEGDGNSSKSNGNKGVLQQRGWWQRRQEQWQQGWQQATAMATMWAMATAMMLVGKKEDKCKGSKGDGDGDEGGWQWQQRLKPFQQWQRRQQWLWQWHTATETAGSVNNQ
jgi:hypothetical protein